jgi:hypothetical protein
MQDDGCAQDGDAVWRHGGVDDKALQGQCIDPYPEDGSAEDGGGDFWSACNGVR